MFIVFYKISPKAENEFIYDLVKYPRSNCSINTLYKEIEILSQSEFN